MMFNDNVLKRDEAAVFALRDLYQKYGYSRFKMSKFEEYDLYVRNKDFLVSEGVITFMDNDGKLLALKPDVTLSIVKNFIPEKGCVQKLYYNENVYRMSKGTKSFKEIMQTGLECMGDIDAYCIAEVIMLAAKSLELINESYILDISHMGVISALAEAVDMPGDAKEQLIKCIGEKNSHGIEELCDVYGVEDDVKSAFLAVVSSYGSADKVISSLKGITLSEALKEPLAELEEIMSVLNIFGITDHINIDFSIVNDMSYYSGVVFRGFVEGLPSGILSGGEYDNLLKKLGKDGGAVGFAVYLDMRERMGGEKKDCDVDVLIIYDEDADIEEVIKLSSTFVSCGKSVLCEREIPQKLTCGTLIKATKEGAKTV